MPMKPKLKIQLAINNMTQKRLAEITGLRPATISAITLGTIKEIPMSALESICATLNCQPTDIIEYIPETTKP